MRIRKKWTICVCLIFGGIFCGSQLLFWIGQGGISEFCMGILKKQMNTYEQLVYHSSSPFFVKLLKENEYFPCIASDMEVKNIETTVQEIVPIQNIATSIGPLGILSKKSSNGQAGEQEGNIQVETIMSGGLKEAFEKEQKKNSMKNTAWSESKRINMEMINNLKKGKSFSYLIKNFYIVDSTTVADKEVFDVKKFLSMDFTIKKKQEPQILIFHTHGGTESFADSRKGKIEDSIVGVGEELAQILRKTYGYQVIHDKTQYDKIGGKIDRNKAYNQSLEGVSKILNKNPSIQVVIDLHRDGANNNEKKVTKINNRPTARFMLFNGLSRNKKGKIGYLYNPNLQGNLAFGLQVKLKAMELYPDLTIKNYLKGYRYNMHLRERYLLIELGNENNTVEEAKNAMEPLAEVLNEVLEK